VSAFKQTDPGGAFFKLIHTRFIYSKVTRAQLLLSASALFLISPGSQAADVSELFPESHRAAVSGANCSFTAKPDDFTLRELRVRRDLLARVKQLDSINRPSHTGNVALALSVVPPQSVKQRNFVDQIIFSRMAGAKIQSAPLSTDEEFMRRVTLDLTGRIPASSDIRAFAADTTPAKRDILIEQLLNSDEYVDKWTMWMGDLLGNVGTASNVQPGNGGRDAFYNYMRTAIGTGKSFRDIAYETVTAAGDTNDPVGGGPSNFIYHQQTPMGPVQDSYDTTPAKSADIFLGVTYYDCLLCHNGRGHLDGISLWGSTVTRTDAQKMAAFFSRLNFNMPRTSSDKNDGGYNSWRVLDRATGSYDLNTTYGNRPNRVAINTVKTLTPVYRDGKEPAAGQGGRDAFGKMMTADPLFARNFANRMFKLFFNLGLVDPVDSLDPARLDPNNLPPAPWELQAANPELLDRLANEAVARDFQLKDFMRILVQSSAYQLSSRYDGDWNIDSIPLFARHYPRRLDAEEVHDAITKSTGVGASYNVNGAGALPILWAMQFPDPNVGGSNLLNSFFRGNRDSAQRSSAGSILQRLTIMNDSFITTRTKVAASPVLQAASKNPDNKAVVEELFLTFVSRHPSDSEQAQAVAYLAAPTTATRNNAIEDLAWALINKIDFLYSY